MLVKYLSIVHVHLAQYNNTISENLTEKQQKPPIKVKMKIGDIEFEIEAQEDQIQNTVDKILAHRHRTPKKHQPRPSRRTPSPPATSRNMQRRHPKTLGRKLVHRTTRLRRRPHRTRTQRLPLRPHSRSTRTRRLGQRQHTNTHRQTTQIPVRTKKTPNMILSLCKTGNTDYALYT